MYIRGVALFGCGTWVINEAEAKTEAFEMWCLETHGENRMDRQEEQRRGANPNREKTKLNDCNENKTIWKRLVVFYGMGKNRTT